MSVIQPVCLEVKQLFYIFSHFYCQPMASFNSKMLNILKIYVKFTRIQTHKNTEITTNATPIHLNSAAAQSLNKQFMLNVLFGTKKKHFHNFIYYQKRGVPYCVQSVAPQVSNKFEFFYLLSLPFSFKTVKKYEQLLFAQKLWAKFLYILFNIHKYI